jgi:hypothetical protein
VGRIQYIRRGGELDSLAAVRSCHVFKFRGGAMPHFVENEGILGDVVDILAVSFGTWLGARRGLCSRFHPTFQPDKVSSHVISNLRLQISGEHLTSSGLEDG